MTCWIAFRAGSQNRKTQAIAMNKQGDIKGEAVIGQHKRDLAVVPYRSGWLQCFEKEAARLRRVLGKKALRIEHIGSTSIPGMTAKPIIDILVAVESLAGAVEYVPTLVASGYIYKPLDVIPERLFFAKESPPEYRTHHLNLAEPGSGFWRNHLAFRDYLRSHDEMAAEYVVLKQRLARAYAETKQLDRDGKTAFVTSVLDLAEKEREMIRAAAVQFNHKAGDQAYNFGRIEHFCRLAAGQGVRLISFPEMCITGYWHVRKLDRAALFDLAEPVPDGPSCDKLRQLAHKHNLIIGAGLIERGAWNDLYNTYVVVDVNGVIHKHRKIHCFINQYMCSGNEYTVLDTSLGYKVGILICYDNNIIENGRITALMGADILLAPHQTGGVRSKSPHAMGLIDPDLWRNRKSDPAAIEREFRGEKGRGWLLRWLPSRAHDNGYFLIFSNGVGLDDDEVRTGNAMIIDCYGRIVSETWRAKDDIVIADLDMRLLEKCTGRRWRRGRKPELYGPLTEPTGDEVEPREARFS
jgi:predicted amidohydrolase/GrpB-like predicted nucleotidyltransferase (UPF0157 family)